MKLLSYHIENYGKIHNEDGNFQDLTVACERNGFGKTTLVSFIKAMFYGLPSYTAATKTFCDRQHFYPFTGGKFGGNLTFEMGGKIYKIERFFDKKSNKGDECKVYCNGMPYDGFGEDVGRAVFALDEASFERTVFITANEVEISATHSINEKLNRTVEGGEDSFETAVSALEKAKKELRASRGNNDRISNKKSEILDLTGKIRNLEKMSEGLASEYAERERLTQEIAILQAQALSAGKWEVYAQMDAQARKEAETLSALQQRYPNGLPTENERAEMQNAVRERENLQARLASISMTEEKVEKLSLYRSKFQFGAPMDEDIACQQENLRILNELENEKKRLQKRQETDKQKQCKQRFINGVPTEEVLSKNREIAENYRKKSMEWNALSSASATKTAQGANEALQLAKTLLFPIFGMLALLVGVILLSAHTGAGLALMIVGILTAMVGLVFGRKKTNGSATDTAKLAELQAEIGSLEAKLRSFTVPYGYYGEAGALFDFASLEEDVRAYQTFLVEEESQQLALAETEQKAHALRAQLCAFLGKYGALDDQVDFQTSLLRLLSDAQAYETLLKDEAFSAQEKTKIQTAIATAQNALSQVVQKYALTQFDGSMSALNALERDGAVCLETEKELTELRKKMLEYKEKNGLTDEEKALNLESSAGDLSEKQRELASLDRRIEETEREVEKLNDYRSAFERAEETLAGYQSRYEVLSDTLAMLQTAEQSLKDKYIAPIKERFSHYAELIERVLNEKVSMDKDFRVIFERGGEARSERHFSAGERTICALCLRLALIDNMYEGEKPFLLLDDPFVHLDAEHLSRALKLIKNLAKERQILYFCCHEARTLSADD